MKNQLKENQLTYVDDKGNEILCDILFTFENNEFNKNYVLFYPTGSLEEEEIQVYAASYEPLEGEIGELNEITTDEEWKMIEEVLTAFENDNEEESEE
ncbi:MAG: DUF1292 domain-containing protein [Bacilli bacterium]|nr:DUF1292 domain-containing protein [Bacilli bacterium]